MENNKEEIKKEKTNKKNNKIIASILLASIVICAALTVSRFSEESSLGFKPVKSIEEFKRISYSIGGNKGSNEILTRIGTLPISMLDRNYKYSNNYSTSESNNMMFEEAKTESVMSGTGAPLMKNDSLEAGNDYSTTNIQVTNVDEADIVKTDGEYIYSILNDKVLIIKADDLKIVSEVKVDNALVTLYPEDIMLLGDKMTIISSSPYRGANAAVGANYGTVISIYDMKNKEEVKLLKEIALDADYYSLRRVDNMLYVISTAMTRNIDVPVFYLDGAKKEIPCNNIRYRKDSETYDFTYITSIDLNDDCKENVNGYIMSVDNMYMSDKNLYLAEEKYVRGDTSNVEIKDVFGIAGIFGPFIKEYNSNYDYRSKTMTEITKFSLNSGNLKYTASAEVLGRTLNQFSLDEHEGKLRVTLEENDSNTLLVLDENLAKIGEIKNIAPNEDIKSTRFIGDRAYMVTYKTMDPLFVIDLKNPKEPKILGELKIPGYSSYIHPYDDNHIIGIGVDTKESIIRDDFGKVIRERAEKTGLKIAIFDVTDVKNPVVKSEIKVANPTAESEILSNHKCLLFSKEKELLGIPVRQFEDAENRYSYTTGYNVYNLSLDEGLSLKGVISHAGGERYENISLRGMYVNDILYTLSQKAIKANKLSDLSLVNEIDLMNLVK